MLLSHKASNFSSLLLFDCFFRRLLQRTTIILFGCSEKKKENVW